MTLGLVLSNNKVRVVLVEDGVYVLGAVSPQLIEGGDVRRHMATLQEFGCDIIAEEQSLKSREITAPTINVTAKGMDEIYELLADSDYLVGI
jgi:sulfur relay (sulfurtransferase) DsrF/TusC family protein